MGWRPNAASLESLCAADLGMTPCSVWVAAGSSATGVQVAASHVAAVAILCTESSSAGCDVLMPAASVLLSVIAASSGSAALLAWDGDLVRVSSVMSACKI